VLVKTGNLFFLLWELGGEVAFAGLHGQAIAIQFSAHFHSQAMVAAILRHKFGGKFEQV
jgi:hypothetical protein